MVPDTKVVACFCANTKNAIVFKDEFDRPFAYLLLDFTDHIAAASPNLNIRIDCMQQYILLEKYFKAKGITNGIKE